MESQLNAVPSVSTAAVTPQANVGASLDAPVPQIVITEASPLNNLETLPSPPEDVAVQIPEDVLPRSASPSTESSDPRKQELQCEDDEKFEAPVECAQCVVPVPQSGETPASEVAQNTEATPETVARDIGTETRETEDDDDFRSVEGSYHLCAGCRGFYYRMADSLSGVYSIPFWLVLLVIPVSAGFMGAKYTDGCPGRSTLPFLLFLLGVGGFIMLLSQLCYVIGTTVCREVESCIKPFVAHLAYTAAVVSLMALLAETVSFFTLTPNSNRMSPKFCHPTFYEYTRWMTYTVWLLTLLIVAIRCPVACIRFNRSARTRPLNSPIPATTVNILDG